MDLDVAVDGAPALEGTPASAPDPAPEGIHITWSDISFATTPPCTYVTGELLLGITPAQATSIEQAREDAFVQAYEAIISSSGIAPQPCTVADPGTPTIDPAAAQTYADDAISLLPQPRPTISGGYAITGLRSWLDLGRPSTFTDEQQLDLGPFTRTARLTATATTSITWGDGTTTTHTGSGGGYHDGDPGPDDITHTYADRTDANVLQVTDTWTITVSVPGLDDIVLTHSDPTPATLTFDVREVRSTRDR